MQITFDTNNLSELDRNVLALVLGQPADAPATKPEKAESTAKPAPKAKPQPKAEEPVEQAEEPVEAAAEETTADAPAGGTMEDAVALATSLVSNGKAAQVKAALADCGAKRVSELADDKIASFIAALS
jgi:hypothetical protein